MGAFVPKRRRFALAAVVLLVSLTASAGGDSLHAAGGKPPPPPDKPKQIKADRNGDKIFDDLEAKLGPLGEESSVDAIVLLEGEVSDARLQRLVEKVGAMQVSHRFSVVDGFAGSLRKRQIKALAALSDVVHVEENSVVHSQNDTAQASFGVAAARAQAGVDGDGDGDPSRYSKDDLVAAVIDTGIDPQHADLNGGKVLAFKDWVGGRTTAYDDNGHGTQVAATIACDGEGRPDRLYRGVVPAAGLVALKVLDSIGNGSIASVTAAIDWVVANRSLYGIEAINLSLATSGCSSGTDSASLAVNRAHDAGLVVVVAAGNEGPGTCTIGSPGAAAKALTVVAMADTTMGGFKLAPFSGRGPTVDGRIKPDVLAPGWGITSALAGSGNGYRMSSGTSMAAPFVVGLALLMRDVNGALSPQGVKDRIMQTAIDWGRGGDETRTGSRGADIDHGAGRLDGYAAIAAAGGATGGAPAAPAHLLLEGILGGTGAQATYPVTVSDTTTPVAATLITPAISAAAATTPDLDLFLYDSGGALVATGDTSKRQDDLSYSPPLAGQYTLKVVAYSGGGSYFVDLSGGLTMSVGTPPPPPPPPPPKSLDFLAGSGPGGGPHVKLFSGREGNVLGSFFAYEPGYTGGCE